MAFFVGGALAYTNKINRKLFTKFNQNVAKP